MLFFIYFLLCFKSFRFYLDFHFYKYYYYVNYLEVLVSNLLFLLENFFLSVFYIIQYLFFIYIIKYLIFNLITIEDYFTTN